MFAGHLDTAAVVSIVLDNNTFSGPLNNVFASTTFNTAKLTDLRVTANSNDFDGVLPSWIAAMPNLFSYFMTCDNCKLSSVANSTLPSSSVYGYQLTISVVNNQIVGPITSSFLALPSSPLIFTLSMSGTLPADLFDSTHFDHAYYVTLDFSNAGLVGPLPNVAGVFGGATVYSARFDSNNMLTGALPSTFLPSIRKIASNAAIVLNLANTVVSGVLALPNFGSTSIASWGGIALDVSNTSLTSVSFPNGTSALRSLTIGNNPTLTGSLPSSFFELNPKLEVLSAFNTGMNGTMPDMGTLNPSALKTLALSDTDIDFCSGDRITWNSSQLTSCQLEHTTAFNCTSEYPSICVITAPPPVVPTAPVFEPQISQPISTPVTIPITPESPAVSTPTLPSHPDVGPISVPVGATPTRVSEPSVLPTPPSSTTRPAISVAVCALICIGFRFM